MPFEMPFISLLWQDEDAYNKSSDYKILPENTITDLKLDYILEKMNLPTDLKEYLVKIFSMMCYDKLTLEYRQEIAEELISNKQICDILLMFSDDLNKVGQNLRFISLWDNEHYKAVCHFNAFSEYIYSISKFINETEKINFTPASQGLKKLLESLKQILESSFIQSMIRDIEEIRPEMEALHSLTLGIGVLKGSISEIVVIPEQDFNLNVKNSIINRINESLPGFAKVYKDINCNVHNVATFTNIEQDIFKILVQSRGSLFNKLLMFKEKYGSFCSTNLSNLCNEIKFYLASIKLIKFLKERGITFCRPLILDMKEKIINLKGVCDISLAFNEQHIEQQINNNRAKIVLNDVVFNENARIYIVTGPNSGGKTTFLRAVGLAQIFFQAGLTVPAEYAEMSPVDSVFTHFPRKEVVGDRKGRLGEEAERLSKIFDKFTGNSMLLLNETFSSTHVLDGYYLGCDLLRFMMELNCIGVYVTHIYDLAYEADALNSKYSAGSRIGTLSACVDKNQNNMRTYKILPAKPSGLSYSGDIVRKYGMSWTQLEERLKIKGVCTYVPNKPVV